MRAVVPVFCHRRWFRAAVIGVVTVGFAGCSAENSRFSDSVFSNPFASRNAGGSSELTGSVPPAQAAPVGRVESRPLQQSYSTQALPAPPNAGRAATAVPPSGQAGGGRRISSYSAVSAGSESAGTMQFRPKPSSTSSVRTASAAPGWSWNGGTAVVVGPGENIDQLSRKYGVPASAILQANGFTNPAAIRSGQRLVIPRYNHGRALASAASRPPATAITPSSGAGVHVVAPGETLTSISRLYGKQLTEVAAANNIVPQATVKAGDRLVIPGRVAAASKATSPTANAPQPPSRGAQAPTANQQVAAVAPVHVATPTAEASADTVTATNDAGGGAPSFRWPVRGRVIAGFGPNPNGQQNDGINLAVPEGTAVRAAEDGVVAYAGNELKGYGNLILIRHSGGYVTAYAHASEILVKRNDQVRRGQVIGKSGQTGTITTPQLHFEVRKGSTPVDPMQFLPAG